MLHKLFKESNERIKDKWKGLKKRITFLREYEEERTEAQLNFYKLYLKMRDSSKSNRVTSPGFLPSLQQKAAHCTPRVSMKPKPPSCQRARNKLSRGISLRAAAERALGKTEATSWGLKAQSRITEQVPDTPPPPPRGRYQGYSMGRPWPIWRKRSQEPAGR